MIFQNFDSKGVEKLAELLPGARPLPPEEVAKLRQAFLERLKDRPD